MRNQLYWLSDAEWNRIEPLMPHGRAGHIGSMIGGMMHMLRYGARWRDCPPDMVLFDDLQSLQSLEPAGHLDRYLLRPNYRIEIDEVDVHFVEEAHGTRFHRSELQIDRLASRQRSILIEALLTSRAPVQGQYPHHRNPVDGDAPSSRARRLAAPRPWHSPHSNAPFLQFAGQVEPQR